tara:strand:- start:510 stop:803 length:294 start_codon:yes stop_codon:yes gene_type:complete
MFKNVFQEIFDLHSHTQILEACEWDEERAAELIEIFSQTINNVASAHPASWSEIIDEAIQDVEEDLSSEELDTLAESLGEMVEKMSSLLEIAEEYEN